MTNGHKRGRYPWSVPAGFDMLSPGGWLICGLAVISTLVVLLWPIPEKKGLAFWIFAKSDTASEFPMIG